MEDIALIDQALRAAGIPIVSVELRRGVVAVQYDPTATDAQRQQGDALVAGWDDVLGRRKAVKAAAKAALFDTDDATRVAIRNTQRVFYTSIVEMRQWMNSLRKYLLDPANNSLPPALSIRTWKQAMAVVQQQTDAEIDPEEWPGIIEGRQGRNRGGAW